MTSKKAIKELAKAHPLYSLQVEATTGGAQGQGAKAIIQILKTDENGKPFVERFSSAYGTGADLDTAQEKAIVKAVQGLGL